MIVNFLKNHKGMSLLEITIAMIVLSVVVLSAGTVYVSGLKELNRCMEEARVQKEAFFVLDHIFLNLMGATGIVTAAFPSNEITVTTNDTAYTPQIKYSIVADSGAQRIQFTSGLTGTPVSEFITTANVNVDNLTFTRPLNSKMDGTGNIINNYVAVKITVTSGRMTETYSTGVVLRGMSGA